ncbi:hypothetical protein [Qipengyuania psychrotolerans]|uniref:Uncharacterized protein n=1 Tax=Qipengyuania psychrotolerans TaxID=2867238 RepID=A0ABX8ZFD7_9SPHN|nr:hypothetical protein [Qipengyuania psychrotolerans]QZD87702.1 hypothetical protein K3166_03095 [Qipengyuania psychrotolerans]
MSWTRAAIAGLLFAFLMCGWAWFDRNPGFDELAIRFSVYFLAFTVGFRFLYNMATGRKA